MYVYIMNMKVIILMNKHKCRFVPRHPLTAFQCCTPPSRSFHVQHWKAGRAGLRTLTLTEWMTRTLGSTTCSLGEWGCWPPNARPAMWSAAISPTKVYVKVCACDGHMIVWEVHTVFQFGMKILLKAHCIHVHVFIAYTCTPADLYWKLQTIFNH